MKSVIQWAVNNSPAMNTFMITVMLAGAVSLLVMRREIFPEFELDIILVTVPYPGASPSEVEEGICQKMEEAVRSISGIKKQTSVAREGTGFLVLELESNIKDAQKTLNEVRAEIDRIPSFPLLAEDPEVTQLTFRSPAIRVGILGPDDKSPEAELELRSIAEKVREDLLQQPSVSQANLINVKNYQIDIEISEETLRKYGLTLQRVAQIVRRENIELPGGKMTTDSQDVVLRGKNKRLTGEEIAKIPLVTDASGVVLTVADLGTVRDEFDDSDAMNRVDGKPAMVISIDRTASEDLLQIVDEVREYVAGKRMPPGYELRTWQDASVDVADRMDLLLRNGFQGLALVFLVLAIFLDLRLAFWVALGIPIAVLGAGAVLLYAGQTLNMLSMFAFLLVLGIVVDDAIVIGENIYAHRQSGGDFITAAINGTHEVLPAVAASVATTVIAFVPLLFVSGVMGKFIAVMPVAVIAMLIISLVESTFILPCHLSHEDNLFFRILGVILYPFRVLVRFFGWVNHGSHHLVHHVTWRYYLPALGWSLNNAPITICLALAMLVFTFGFVRSGITPWVLFPKLDTRFIEAKIAFPDGTPASVTRKATMELEAALKRVDQRCAREGQPVVNLYHQMIGAITGAGSLGPDSQTAGGHVGTVYAELVDNTQRKLTSDQILAKWRKESPRFVGAERLTFESPSMGPGGRPIEFKMLARASEFEQLEKAVEECKARLAEFPGVFDIRDDSTPGKWEYQLKVKESAVAMGVTAADLAETVRASYYGEEVMRLQRGRHEVKLMVRYPRHQRRSLADFERIRVRTGDGSERPLTELAEITNERGYSEVNRVDQLRSITITADVDDTQGNAYVATADLRTAFMPKLFERYPDVRVRWEGQQEQSNESMKSLGIGFIVAVFGMFCLLTLEFRSYIQPLVILAVIPFGFMGAIWGHALLGIPLTLFSMFGLVSLTGVVVNDSIVLMDFINKRIQRGVPLRTALLEAGRRRFRPVLLTSITTVAGLTPILLETSFQAQVIIPMAASLSFGLIAATGLVLILVPTLYYVYGLITGMDVESHRDEKATSDVDDEAAVATVGATP
ncbi:MAG: efflux RND transporter permease subunit [Pirellulaceae bacterium]